MPLMNDDDYALTEEQKNSFLENGYLKIPKCFTREASDAFTSSVWTRLGMSPTDKSTWTIEKSNMPGHSVISAKEFAPKAWAAMCELVGGEEKIADWCKDWRDSFIPNFGRPEYSADDELDYRQLDNWHNDGDFFMHFLDSPEQALLVIPLFSDIKRKGGGTYEHPQGMTPFLMPRGSPDIPKENPERHQIWNGWVRNPDETSQESFTEATGECGDVYILHPFMLHSASKNLRRDIRIITNPPVSLKEPFNYNRSDPSEYSLVEQKTLRDLGRPEGLPEWKITEPRERVIPDRVKIQKEMKAKEMERLKAQNVTANGLSSARAHEFYYPA